MALAVVFGALSGFAGFLPLLGSLQLTKKVTDTSNLGHMGALLLGVLLSFGVLAAAVIVCAVFFRSLILPFAAAEVVALSVTAIVFGISKIVRK